MLSHRSIALKFIILLFAILALTGGAYYLILKNVYQQQLQVQARTVVEGVESFGLWVAKNGRVWVRDNADSYLGHLAVKTTSDPEVDVDFYSKNPALATRELSEVVESSATRAKFRMTSHNVMNPVNKPDEFDQIALKQIRTNNIEEFFDYRGSTFRYAKAVYHNASCIACHGDPKNAPQDVLRAYGSKNGFGFKAGDVAGIISVALPTDAIFISIFEVVGPIEVLLIFLCFILSWLFVQRIIIKPMTDLTGAVDKISMGQDIDLGVSDLSKKSGNEMHMLMLAVSRLKNSIGITVNRMKKYEGIIKAANKQQAERLKNEKE